MMQLAGPRTLVVDVVLRTCSFDVLVVIISRLANSRGSLVLSLEDAAGRSKDVETSSRPKVDVKTLAKTEYNASRNININKRRSSFELHPLRPNTIISSKRNETKPSAT